MFVENVGQFDAGVRFEVQGRSGTLWLADEALWLTVLQHDGGPTTDDRPGSPSASSVGVNLKLSFVGANRHPRLEPFRRLDTHVSYFMGNDPARWRANVPVWGGVRYVDLYPGIDLELSGGGGVWQPRLVAHAGADLSLVRLRIEGADELVADSRGVRLVTAIGSFSLPLPQAVMADGSHPTSLKAGPEVSHNEISAPFTVENLSGPAAETSANFLIFSTFLGGGNYDAGWGMAVDGTGAVYVTGYTRSDSFPTTPGAFQTTRGGNYDAFVSKLSPDGTSLVYSTYLGGNDVDRAYGGIVVDSSGAAYVAGLTASSNFPTTAGAYQTTYSGGTCGEPPNTYPCADAFVTKLNADGSALVYSTYLGSTNEDEGWDLAVDASGSAYVTGLTASTEFPTTVGAFQTTYGGGTSDGFVTKLSSDGSALLYSTYLGAASADYGTGIALDGSGVAYVSGSTFSTRFPTTAGAFQTACGGCPTYADAFVTKLDASGGGLVYSTFLGGNTDDWANAITVDSAGDAFVTGYASSSDFPTTPGAFQTTVGGGTCGMPPNTYACPDAFVTRLNAAGSGLVYSTFLGSGNYDVGWSITVDTSDAPYVSGYTQSSDFPVTRGASQTVCGGCTTYSDGFAARLSADGTALAYSTYLGGSANDGAYSIWVDANGVSYVAGFTSSSDFPTTPGVFQPTYGGPNSDAFVTKLILATYWLYLPVTVNNP